MTSKFLDFQTETNIIIDKDKQKEHKEFYNLLKKDYVNNQNKLLTILNNFTKDNIVEFISFNSLSNQRVHSNPESLLLDNKRSRNELKFLNGIHASIELEDYVTSMRNLINVLDLNSEESSYKYLIESRNVLPLFLLRSENNNLYSFSAVESVYDNKFNLSIINDTEYFTMYNKLSFNIKNERLESNVDYQLKNSSLLKLKTSHNSKYINETNQILLDHCSKDNSFFNLAVSYKVFFDNFYNKDKDFTKMSVQNNQKISELIDMLSLTDDKFLNFDTLKSKSATLLNKKTL